jgi:hypothetical protein
MTRADRLLRGLLPAALLIGMIAGLAGQNTLRGRAAPQAAPTDKVVISEFRARGPNGGADEFVELYNPTTRRIDISGWYVNWADANSSPGNLLATIPANTFIDPGHHYLIADTVTGGYSGVIAPDLSYQIDNGAIPNDGGIALIDESNQVIDQVGMSDGSIYKEGTALDPVLLTDPTIQSFERKPGQSAGGSCTDTNINSDDFAVLSPADPQNLASQPGTCLLQDTTTTVASIVPSPALINQTVTVQFEITTASGNPTGSVSVFSDGILFCQANVTAGECSNSFTTAGTKQILAKYAGDSTFLESASAPVSLTVSAAVIPSATPTSPVFGGQILINEVAWAGTQAFPVTSTNPDQWIELWNRSSSTIDLTGWTIEDADGNVLVAWDKTSDIKNDPNRLLISPNEYYLIECTDDQAVSTEPADKFFDCDLSAAGEILYLFSSNGTAIDTANLGGGPWPAGTAIGWRSMERRDTATRDTSWATFNGAVRTERDAGNNPINGTPGFKNWVTTVPTAIPPTRVPTARPQPKPRPVINEFLPRAGFDWNNDGRVDVFDEFIEVANLGPADWNTRGWRLDDDADAGSGAFSLPQLTLKPGERAVFYGSQSNVHLSDGGETIRLLDPSGKVYDAQTYPVVKQADLSWCRLPDLRGSWFADCFPTPNFPNSREGKLPSPPPTTGLEEVRCTLADTLPQEFILAECRGYGDNMWSSRYWDLMGWISDRLVRQNGSKWESFVE